MSSEHEKLMTYSLRLLSKKRYTVSELERKLERFLEKRKKRDCSEEEGLSGAKEEVLQRLRDLKYLDDNQYAADYCNERARLRPSGTFLLKRELKIKGVPAEIAEEVVDSLEIDEVELAKDAFERKSRQWKNVEPQKMREKGFRFLSSRGFSPDTIYKVINTCYD